VVPNPLTKGGKVKLADLEGKTTLLRPIRDASAFSAAIHEDDGSAEKVTFGGATCFHAVFAGPATLKKADGYEMLYAS
jgi:hypothetical protein